MIFFISQYLLWIFLRAAWGVLWLLLKSFAYVSFFIVSYTIAGKILTNRNSFVEWLALIFILSFLQYLVMYFLKGLLIGLKYKNNFIWFPLLIVCTVYTCLFPGWLVYEFVKSLAIASYMTHAVIIALNCALIAAIYIYKSFCFHIDCCPVPARPFYQFGLNLAGNR